MGARINVYQVFDKFLAMETWHTAHDLDGERFYRALGEVVRDKDFSPDQMAAYMSQKIGVSRGDDNYRADAIERYTSAAWAVRDFLVATKAI
jgi:hypothetical protein